MTTLKQLKQFVFDGMLADEGLSQLVSKGIQVKGAGASELTARVTETDFSPVLLHDSKKMASVFVAFFCLENAARDLIVERLSFRKGPDWWVSAVPEKIRRNVQTLKDKEKKNKYHAQRSANDIGYTFFGNLAQIIIANWDEFSDLIPDQHWILSRFNDLEMSRNIIMHTGLLPQIEIERIDSIVRDWLRQVG